MTNPACSYDIFARIISFLGCDADTLSNVRLVSHLANEAAEPLLFSTVRFTIDLRSSYGFRDLFLRTPAGLPVSTVPSRIRHVFLDTGGLLLMVRPMVEIFQALQHVAVFNTVSIVSSCSLTQLDGYFISNLLGPVAFKLVSLRLEHVSCLPDTFFLSFPLLQSVVLAGVSCRHAKENSRICAPLPRSSTGLIQLTTFQYAEKSPYVRNIWDNRVLYFRPKNHRFSAQSLLPNSIGSVPRDSLWSNFEWSRLGVLYLETGFPRDVMAALTILPRAASTLHTLHLEVTGLISKFREWN